MKSSVGVCLFLGVSLFSSASEAEMTAQLRKNLIKNFAPLVKFHKKERYFPSSVPWFLDRSELRALNAKESYPSGFFEKPRIEESSTVVLSRPEMEVLSRINSSDLKGFLPEIKKFSLGLTQQEDPGKYFVTPKGTHAERQDTFHGEPLKDNQSEAPVYANLVEKPGGAVIQYVFFYPFNGPPLKCLYAFKCLSDGKRGIHEGDVEHIDVHLTKNANSSQNAQDVQDAQNSSSSPSSPSSYEAYEISEVYFAEHGASTYGYLAPVSDVERVEDPETGAKTHPVVYSAFYGHASYPHRFWGFKLQPLTLDRTSRNGAKWETWRNAVDVGTLEHPASGQGWLRFAGSWGYDGEAGPAQQDWWRTQARQTFPLTRVKVDLKKGMSDPFDLQVPPRFRKLTWRIDHPKSGEMKFSVTSGKSCCSTSFFDSLAGSGADTSLPPTLSHLSISDLVFSRNDLGNETSVDVVIEAVEE